MDYGIVVPFYVEVFLNDDDENKNKLPAQNYTPYDLFSLKSKILNDPTFVRYSEKHCCTVEYDYHYRNLLLYAHISIIELGEDDMEVKNSPEWFKDLVYHYLNYHKNYVVLFSDAYPLKVNLDTLSSEKEFNYSGGTKLNFSSSNVSYIPYWWLQYVIPYLDYEKMIRYVFYPEQLDDNTTKIEPYKWFYENGQIYINLIDFNDPDTFYNPNFGDVTEVGDKAMIRGDNMAHGDYLLYSDRYTKLREMIENAVRSLYSMGAIPINVEEFGNKNVINDWDLKPLVTFNGINEKSSLYFPSWNDVRITLYDGSFNLIKRQLNYYNNQCDYQIVFIHHIHPIGKGNQEKNNKEKTMHIMQIMYDLYNVFNKKEFYVNDTFIGIEIKTKKEAIEIADRISSYDPKTTQKQNLVKKRLTNNIDNKIKVLNSTSNGFLYKNLATGDYYHVMV
jgi:hypothetical protein